MTNANDLAYPVPDTVAKLIHEGYYFNDQYLGLTKREYFAAMAMQGLLANYAANGMYGNYVEYPMVEKAAVSQADALIKALNESE